MKNIFVALLVVVFTLSFSAVSLADTIRLKDGTVLRGQIAGFRDGQFTVLIGSGARGRRSRMMLYMEDVESIEFDAATGATGASANVDNAVDTSASTARSTPATTPAATSAATPAEPRPIPNDATANNAPPSANTSRSTLPTSPTSPNFFQVNTRVRADNATNGWTNSGLVVRRGQRLRITASGRVTLGQGRFSTPAGIPTLPDADKLMRNEPTGAVIGVIGDNNDDFFFIGNRREFVAQRDGVLFLGVNEGNLNDNTGAYDVVIEAEAISGTTR